MAKKTERLRQQGASGSSIDRGRPRLFGEFLTRPVNHDGKVRVGRRRHTETLLQPDLPRRRIEQIDAAHDGIDALCRIIDDDGQLVRVLTIGTQEDKVADLALKILAMLALNTIEKDELAIRHAQAPRAGRTAFRQTRPTKPWVEQTTIDRQMIGRRGNFAARAGTRVDVAIELQTDERRVVDIEPPALNQDFSVPLEAESIQRAQDGIGGTRHRARPINVLDAHQPFAAMCPRIEITADGGDKRTEMQRPGRRRRKAAAILGSHTLAIWRHHHQGKKCTARN